MTKREKHGVLDEHGRRIPMDPEDVRRVINNMMEKGDVVALLVRFDGNILVKMFFHPDDMEMTELVIQSFEAAVESLRGMVKQRGH